MWAFLSKDWSHWINLLSLGGIFPNIQFFLRDASIPYVQTPWSTSTCPAHLHRKVSISSGDVLSQNKNLFGYVFFKQFSGCSSLKNWIYYWCWIIRGISWISWMTSSCTPKCPSHFYDKVKNPLCNSLTACIFFSFKIPEFFGFLSFLKSGYFLQLCLGFYTFFPWKHLRMNLTNDCLNQRNTIWMRFWLLFFLGCFAWKLYSSWNTSNLTCINKQYYTVVQLNN